MRIGFGYDVHRLVAGRKLVLGGVAIPFDKGLLGHSDADVLVHAICDALLGASGSGDIGIHFPDTASEYKDISSIRLLEKTHRIISDKGFAVINVDCTVVAQAPKIFPYREAMQQVIADTIHIPSGLVNIKATTNEQLGFIGKGQGIGAYCVALISETA